MDDGILGKSLGYSRQNISPMPATTDVANIEVPRMIVLRKKKWRG
jgi:hypothetical protein